jgi:hypothetical protein
LPTTGRAVSLWVHKVIGPFGGAVQGVPGNLRSDWVRTTNLMQPTPRQLDDFHGVTRCASVHPCSRGSAPEPSGVSMQIRQLGGTAGLTLFGKLGKKIHLTRAGSDFFRYS